MFANACAKVMVWGENRGKDCDAFYISSGVGYAKRCPGDQNGRTAG